MDLCRDGAAKLFSMTDTTTARLWLLIKRHFQAPLVLAFAQFKLGAMVFFFGLVLVYMAQQLLQPSLRQELFMLLGLGLAGVGFIIAMAAHVRMLISRLTAFFRPRN